MKRKLLVLILSATAVTLSASEISQEQNMTKGSSAALSPKLDPEMLLAMQQRLKMIADPAARLFFRAGLEQVQGDPERALQTLALLLVQHANNEKWIARGDLMCAELYMELGMLDAADVTARQVQVLHEGTNEAKKATVLREKIKQETEQSAETE